MACEEAAVNREQYQQKIFSRLPRPSGQPRPSRPWLIPLLPRWLKLQPNLLRRQNLA